MRYLGTNGLNGVFGLTGRAARLAAMAVFLVTLFVATGCDDDDEYVDVTPPAIPAGVSSITADGEVILFWYPNREPDLKGYRIWWNEDDSSTFERLADIDAFDDDYYDPGTGPGDDFMLFSDFPLANGTYYFYAISAYDDLGNESDLSLEYVYDVPRPEGVVMLQEADVDATRAGFDFSRAALDGAPQNLNLDSTDLYYEVDGQDRWLVVKSVMNVREVRIQDYGFAGFDGLSYAPGSGYSQRDRVEAIPGHAYAISILTNPGAGNETENYAKVWVESASPSEVVLWWGYQEVEGEPQLKNPVAGALPASEEVRR